VIWNEKVKEKDEKGIDMRACREGATILPPSSLFKERFLNHLFQIYEKIIQSYIYKLID